MTLKDIADELKKRLQQGVQTVGGTAFNLIPPVNAYNSVKKVVQHPYFNPTSNNGNNFWGNLDRATPGGIEGGIQRVQNAIPQLPTAFGNYLRSGVQQITPQPLQKYIQPIVNVPIAGVQGMAGMFTNSFRTGMGSANKMIDAGNLIGTGIKTNDKGKVVQGLAKAAYGIGNFAAVASPLYQGANFVVNQPQIASSDTLRRVASGVTQGMGDIESPNVPQRNIKILGMEFDPLVTAGNMIGFVKNPTNTKIFGETTKLLNLTKNMSNWFKVGSLAAKGGIEGLLMSLGDLPEKDREKYIAQNIAFGSASEIGFAGASKVVGNIYGALKPFIKETGEATIKYTRNALGQFAKILSELKGKFPSEVNMSGKDIKFNEVSDSKYERGFIDVEEIGKSLGLVKDPTQPVKPVSVPQDIIPQKTYSAVPTEAGLKKLKLQQERAAKITANNDYKEWQKTLFAQEGATRTPYMQSKANVEDIGKSISKNTKVGGVGAEDLKDISGFKAYTRDVYRNFKEVYGKGFENIKRVLLDPFDQAKGNLSRNYANWSKRINKEIEIDLGIKKGSKESAATQMFGEDKLTYEEIVQQFGQKKADNIVKADQWFRKEYDQLLDEVNAVMKRIYPNNPEKLIPKRQDYYRHFREMSRGISGLLNIFDSPANIKSSLAGTSEFTKPKSKWLSFAQKRLGGQTDVDAVGGFIDYVKAAEYSKNIDPFTSKFGALADDLAKQTEADPKLNGFIEYLHDFSRDLAGKTNPADRFIQKVIPGGRKAMSVINWLNNRVKANVILGNASSSLAQIFNVPQGIADAGPGNSIKGLGYTIANIFDEATPIKKSNFITERYGSGAFDRFDRGMINNTRKFAAWMVTVLDNVGTKYIWNSEYAKALSNKVPNPIKFADDATRGMVAGRGIGEVPLIQKSKVFQMVAPFQLEVANLWHVMGDWVGEKQFGKLATFFAASYVFNRTAEKIRGSDVSLDPIQASIDAYNAYKEEEDKKIGLMRAGGRLAGEVISNVPLGQSLAAAYPEYGAKVGDTQLPTREQFFGKGDPTRFGSGLLVTKGLQDPLFKILPPFAGQQIKRSIEGIGATEKGYSESATGKVRFPTEQTPLRNIQRAVFGQYSTPEAREYFDTNTSVLGDKQSETYKKLLKTDPAKAQQYYDSVLEARKKDKPKTTNTKSNGIEVNAAESGESVSGGNISYVKDGELIEVDLDKSFEYPTFDKSTAIGKEAISRYKSGISTQVNKIYDAYEAGAITQEVASEKINALSIAYDKTKAPKKAKKGKKITVKFTKSKVPTITLKRRAAPKLPTIKFKKPKITKSTIRRYTIK